MIEVPAVEQKILESDVQLMEWARLFDEDPKARETIDGAKQVELAAESIRGLVDQGYEIDTIELRGWASDEDDSGEPNAGLGVDSPKNVRLGEVRAEEIRELLVDKLNERGITDAGSKMEVSGGERRDDALNQEIIELAQKRNQTPQQMIEKWNRQDLGSFSQGDLELYSRLADDRCVEIEVTVSRIITETKEVYEEGEWVEKTERHKEFSIVIIPIILAWPSRRNKSSKPDGGLLGPDSDVFGISGSALTAGSVKVHRAVNGAGYEGATNAFGIPDKHLAKRSAVFSADMTETGGLSPKSVATITDIAQQGSIKNGVELQPKAPVAVVPSFVRLPRNPASNGPESNHSKPPRKLGEEIRENNNGVSRNNKQPTELNDGTTGFSRYGRHR